MTDDRPMDAYDRAHQGHDHDTFVITADDMQDADALQRLLAVASRRTQSSSETLDKRAARLGEAMGSNDQTNIRNRQMEYDVAKSVFDGWITHQDRLLRQLGHLDTLKAAAAANDQAKALKWATWALVLVTAALIAATIVGACIASS